MTTFALDKSRNQGVMILKRDFVENGRASGNWIQEMIEILMATLYRE